MVDHQWKARLRAEISQLQAGRTSLRIAVAGVGNEFNGDDGIGFALVRLLESYFRESPNILVLQAGSIPENLTGSLRRFAPQLVILIDAASLGEEAGTVRYIEWDEVECSPTSPHGLSLTLIASYLEIELGCKVILLGVQPHRTSFGSLSPFMQVHVERIARELWSVLTMNRMPLKALQGQGTTGDTLKG
jgi:hydrogenase 3 maturation protease